MLNGMAGTALAAKVREQARSYESFAQPLFLLNSGHCEEQVSL